ncbi:MAG: glycosyltransferase [Candidatus Omnitrophica bacterium]|nr:glycosyltransferase [Candidatus Omnitrophota bacterium]
MSAKHIALMYISEVSGHRSCALAIEEAVKRLQPDAAVLNINAFNYTNPVSEKIVNRIYMGIIKRAPGIWDYLYDNPSVVRRVEKIKERIHRFNSPKFKKLFEQFQPDVVACTQAFPCGMVAAYKKNYKSEIPLVAVLTDYVPHSYWVYEEIDCYIVPSEEVALRLHKKGVALHKIKTFGIPFSLKFNKNIPREETIRHHGLDPALPTVLLMGGGQGLGPINNIVRKIDRISSDFQCIIVCGTNKKLYRSMKDKVKDYRRNILVFGYSSNIDSLMSISDMIITKPGGITTAEALAKKLPMIIVKPIPGQETNNTSYLTRHHAAIKVERPQDVCAVIEDLLEDPGKLERMRQAASSIAKPNASIDTARLLLDLASRK